MIYTIQVKKSVEDVTISRRLLISCKKMLLTCSIFFFHVAIFFFSHPKISSMIRARGKSVSGNMGQSSILTGHAVVRSLFNKADGFVNTCTGAGMGQISPVLRPILSRKLKQPFREHYPSLTYSSKSPG